MKYVALSSTNHADLKLAKRTFFHLQDQPMVPISVSEAVRAALDLPLAFTRKPDNTLLLVAILSLEKDDNPLVRPDGWWTGGYMPAIINCYPFALAFKEDQGILVVNEGSDCLSTTVGEPLFDTEGKPSELLNKITRLLKTSFPNPHRDTPVLEAIDAAGILEPWSDVSENLLKVSRQKLAKLGGESFLDLRQKNILPVLYAQLMSLPRINRIKNLAQQKKKAAEQQIQVGKQAAGKQSLDFSLEKDDELIKFDF
jgi:hypothetical protein